MTIHLNYSDFMEIWGIGEFNKSTKRRVESGKWSGRCCSFVSGLCHVVQHVRADADADAETVSRIYHTLDRSING